MSQLDYAIGLRNKGKHGESLSIIRVLDPSEVRNKIHLCMGYIAAGYLSKAVGAFLNIDLNERPVYMQEALFTALYCNRHENATSDFWKENTNLSYLTLISTAVDVSGFSVETALVVNPVYNELKTDSKNRLAMFFVFLIERALLSELMAVDFDKDKLRRSLVAKTRNCTSNNSEVVEIKNVTHPLTILLSKYLILSDFNNEKLVEIFESVVLSDIGCEVDFSFYDLNIVYLQSISPRNVQEKILQVLSLYYCFPFSIENCSELQIVRAGNLYYRYFHYVSSVCGVSFSSMLESDFRMNGCWHGWAFVKGSISYFGKDKTICDYYYDLVESFVVKLNLTDSLLASLGHVSSALCWRNYLPDTIKDNSIGGLFKLHESKSIISSPICFVVGADPVYANNFLDLFVKSLHLQQVNGKLPEKPAVFANIFAGNAFEENSVEIRRYAEFLSNNSQVELHYRFVGNEHATDSSKVIQQKKGLYTLLRYEPLLSLMKENPQVQYFVVSDIDAVPFVPTDLILELVSEYDIVLSAIHDKSSIGVPSYIGAGCLVIKNNNLGHEFVSLLVKCLSFYSVRHSLNKWNLDQAAIRFAIDKTLGARVGYLPKIGSFLKFANAYSDKATYVKEMSANLGVETYSLELKAL